ncbi:hypothetical protein E4T89_04210 [Jeotgalicoccus nanhaiensis]|uniref:Uncharacterized protein n=1 Tax=Jeotgalicoccus nanhaiensis TaxID=568603 RepID=A0ABR9XX68_9STAP|nr:hypothetical protein [Jeotgalicoccus nanhaiensis]MBF0753467.1 hypothetical protein [Jeotgalicoccus nanhaiensis]TFU62625.1 hypothetical protein E4T89_04210 [Jeotgalicoccus nanhaiensis]
MKKLFLISLSVIALTACSDTESTGEVSEEDVTPSETTTEEAVEKDTENNSTTEADKNDNEKNKEEIEQKTEELKEEKDAVVTEDFYLGVLAPDFLNTVATNPDILAINVINESMSQTDVEALYGESYDRVIPKEGANLAVYGNVAVLYSDSMPYGNDTYANPDISPDTNMVVNFYPVMNVSYQDVINTLGIPLLDYDEYQLQGSPIRSMFYKTTNNDIVAFDMVQTEDQSMIAEMIHINPDHTNMELPMFVKEVIYALDDFYSNGNTYYQSLVDAQGMAEESIQNYNEYYDYVQTTRLLNEISISPKDENSFEVNVLREFYLNDSEDPATTAETYLIERINGEYKLNDVTYHPYNP